VFTKDDTLIDIIIVNPTRVIYFANLVPLKDLLSLMQFKPKNEIIMTDTPPINSSP
jgi:hypothetical protein